MHALMPLILVIITEEHGMVLDFSQKSVIPVSHSAALDVGQDHSRIHNNKELRPLKKEIYTLPFVF